MPAMPAPDLTQQALIATLSMSTLGNRHKDERLTEEVHSRHGMAEDAGLYQKVLLPPDCLKPLQKIVSAARADHRQQTLMTPFGPILPAARIDAFTASMDAWRSKWDTAKAAFIRNYPLNIEAARQKLGRAFDPTAYPDVSELPGIFKFETRLVPLPKPQALDEILGLADSRVAQLRAEMAAATAQAAQSARAELLERLLERLQRVFAMLSQPDGPIHSRTLEKLEEILRLAPAYNLTGDTTITRLVNDCNRTLNLAKETLKDSPFQRQRTAAAATVILQNFGRNVRKIGALPTPPAPAAAA
jgi:hypothetical protein